MDFFLDIKKVGVFSSLFVFSYFSCSFFLSSIVFLGGGVS
jgi:hypothetical protein